jgi:hypothetical protein
MLAHADWAAAVTGTGEWEQAATAITNASKASVWTRPEVGATTARYLGTRRLNDGRKPAAHVPASRGRCP